MFHAVVVCAVLVVDVCAWASELQTFVGVQLVETSWADGDSFRVRFPDGNEHTLRLYGVDCMEWHVSDETDARRLRAQRRYFGITASEGSVSASIELAKSIGEDAATEVRLLLVRSFTVHTAFADARGDGRYRRIYGFVTLADGRDLGTVLVEKGLARAFGVSRGSPDGANRDDYREALKDAELCAAVARSGVWQFTDWNRISAERSQQRQAEAETRIATGHVPPEHALDLNGAARDQLMKIPGIGEHFANAIIENRPYQSVDELLRVRGIGPKRLEALRQWVRVGPAQTR